MIRSAVDRAPREVRLRQLVEAIDVFWDEHERGPTRVELGKRVGLAEDQIRMYLNELRDAGRVTWDPEVRYSLRTR